MEMYATRKGWDIGGVEVCANTRPPSGAPDASGSVGEPPESLSDEQVERRA